MKKNTITRNSAVKKRQRDNPANRPPKLTPVTLTPQQLRISADALVGDSRGAYQTGIYILALKHFLTLAQNGQIDEMETQVNEVSSCLVKHCTYAKRLGLAKTVRKAWVGLLRTENDPELQNAISKL